jgi:putative transposase
MVAGRRQSLDQAFGCDGPDQKWGADISYIWTAEGWLYLAIVLDLYSRRIIGWATSDRLKKDLALNALRRAIAVRQPSPGLIQPPIAAANIVRMTISGS